jgi:hypothetical protein
MPNAGSCCGLDQLWQADQIVAGDREGELEAEFFDTAQHEPSEPADRLAPTERLRTTKCNE